MLGNLALSLAAMVLAAASAAAADLRFERVSEHCFVLRLEGSPRTVSAVGGAGGFLLVNPPAEEELGPVLAALKEVSPAPVLWIAYTDPVYARSGAGARAFGPGAVALVSESQFKRVRPPRAKAPADGEPKKNEAAARDVFQTSFAFERQVTLYPDGVEVRVKALPRPGRTAGDIVVLMPSEKVLMTGDLFQPGAYPDIPGAGEGGSAAGWIDGCREVIDAIPLLKPAMPQPKPDPAKPPREEKPLAELVAVIPGGRANSNLQVMKNLVDAAQRLRSEIGRAASSGRSLETVLGSGSMAPYREWAGFESFATVLFEELKASKSKP